MSTVAKLFVISGLVFVAVNAGGEVFFGLLLIAIGILFPQEKPRDASTERVEALEAYVRKLHRWIVDREAARATTGPVTQPTPAGDAPLPAPEVSAELEPAAEPQVEVEPSVAVAEQEPAPTISADTVTIPEPAIADAIAEDVTEDGEADAEEPVAVSADETATHETTTQDTVVEVTPDDVVDDDLVIDDAVADDTSADAEPLAFPLPEAEPEEEAPEVAAAAFSPVAPQIDDVENATTARPIVAPAAARTARPEPPPPRRSLFDFEQILGTNWLAKAGVAILVIGVSFFLAWQLRELGPAGKVTVGTIVGVVMLGAGIWFERNERYRVLARAVLAGGWALLFFVAWAAHHVTATRVVDSPPVALVLMLLVAGAMVAHTLRYRSQVVTGLAFVLAFSTVAVNQADVFGLTANVVLALAFSAVVVRMRWFELEIVGIVAAYLNHYLWLRPIVLPEQGSIDVAASAATSVTILLLYWAIFRVSFVIRRAPDEKASVIAGLLNSGLLLAVLKVHPAAPDVAFQLLLALGVVELVLSRLPFLRQRRDSFIALTTLGTMFITAAIPLRFAPASVTVAWLINAIVLSVVGILTRERVYRRLGTLVATATALQLILFPLGRIIVDGFGNETATAQRSVGFIALAVAAWLLVEATLLVRRWSELYPEPIEQYLVRALGYLALAIVLPAGWLLFPQNGTAVFWAGAALALALAGRRMANPDLAVHATLLGAAAVLRVLGHNLGIDGPVLELGSRAVTVTVVAILLYALARTHGLARTDGEKLGHAGGLWTGTGLLVLLAAHEVPALQLALVWTGFAFVLALIARRFDSRHITVQANLLTAIAVTWLLARNFSDDAIAFAPFSWRVVSTFALVALLYLLMRWNATGPLATPNRIASVIPSWTAAALLALVVFKELPITATGLGWTLLGFALAAIGSRFRNGHFVAQANCVAVVATAWMFAVGFASSARLLDGPVPVSWRLVSTSGLAGLLYALSRWNAAWKHLTQSVGTIAPRVFANTLLMVLAWHELEAPAVVIGWSVLGFALLYIGRRAKLFDLVVQANLVAAAAAIRVLVVNLPSNAIAFENPWPVSWRIPASLLVIGLLYALAKWNRDAMQDVDASSFDATWRDLAPFVPQWGGTALLVLLAWYELLPAAVAVAWTIIAMVLMEAGLRRGSRSLVLQANALFVVTFGRVFVVNMNIDDFGAIGARVFTIAPIAAALVHAYWRSDDEIRERRLAPRWFPPLLAWLGIACVTALLRFQLASDAVIVGWAALTLLLLAFASMSGRRIFAHMAIAVTLLTLVRAGLHNLYERSYFPSPGALDRWMWVGVAALLLFASLPFAFRLRTDGPPATQNWVRRSLGWLDARPEQLLFFVPLLLVTALIGVEMRSGMLTVAWGLEGVIVFVFALLVRERTFRLSGLALLLLCVGKIFALDFWALTLRDKALTGIVIGLALIGVSVLYSRKRETILKYL